MNPIDPRIHEALDGEIACEALPPELRRAVERLEAAAALLATGAPAGSLESRVMAVIRRPRPSRARRLVRWVLTPQAVTFRLRPAWSLGLAAVVAQFVGRFPEARSVHVVGSFNDWRTGIIVLEDRDHDGLWRGTVVLPAGTYEYMFVVDGERWVPDHLAERQVADDYGRENSIVIVRPVRR